VGLFYVACKDEKTVQARPAGEGRRAWRMYARCAVKVETPSSRHRARRKFALRRLMMPAWSDSDAVSAVLLLHLVVCRALSGNRYASNASSKYIVLIGTRTTAKVQREGGDRVTFW
jgi:hypothetical protein